MTYDLRTHLQTLERYGLLQRVRQEVDKNWELSAIMRWVYKYLARALESWDRYGLLELARKEIPRSIVVEEDYLKKGLAALPRFWPINSEEKAG